VIARRAILAVCAAPSRSTPDPFWTCGETATSAEHVHDYDEYMMVVQGSYTVVINGKRIAVKAGEEYFIPRGVPHSGKVAAGTRTIHAFAGHRADRERF
jgi:mannose-6-phosphate isomerase-like protein (cupin superfamily)